MALNKREQRLLLATITALVLGGSYVVFKPLADSWQTVGRDLVNQRRELKGYQDTVRQLPGWQAQYEQLRRQCGQQMETFAQTSDVLKKIEEVAASSGILITSRKPLPALEHEVYRELPVQCRIEATADSLVKFLYALRTGSGFINVEQLQVSPRPDNANILRCDILIHALAARSERAAS